MDPLFHHLATGVEFVADYMPVSGFQAENLTGFLVAIAFLVVFRGLAWFWKRPSTSTLATSVNAALDSVLPSDVQTYGDGEYTAKGGNLRFNKQGIQSISGASVNEHLTRGERRLIAKKIRALLNQHHDHQIVQLSRKIASSFVAAAPAPAPVAQSLTAAQVQNLINQALAATRPAPVARPTQLAPVAQANPVNVQQAVRGTFNKFGWRSVKGVAKEANIDQNTVAQHLRLSGMYRSKLAKNGETLYAPRV